ncbi:MAG: PQQ-binding-like beta-propeller repeat protein [Deltaproteobacteria bacterium]|nr:PQQ-binding-like beta-propeller repeat protein [Deltaproteobacteria bacterium]
MPLNHRAPLRPVARLVTLTLGLLLSSGPSAFGGRQKPTPAPARPHPSRDLRALVARAEALRASHQDREALPLLRHAIRTLQPNVAITSWASMTAATENAARLGTHITLAKTRIVTFTGGRFTAFDRATGEARWHFDADWAEQSVIPTASGLLLVLTPKEVIALEPEHGRVRWRTSMNDPAPEIVESPDTAALLIADRNELRALSTRDGSVLWRFDPRLDLAAGPVQAPPHVAIAAGTKVFTVQSADGTPVKIIGLGDEISSPLIASPQGSRIWAMVGSDDVVLIDAQHGTIVARTGALRAAAWPATAAGGHLYVSTIRRRASGVVAVTAEPATRAATSAATKDIVARATVSPVPGVTGPVFRVSDGPDAIALDPRRGTVMRLDGQRRRAWRTKISAPIAHATVGAGAIFLAHRNQLDIMDLDATPPRVTRTLALDREILSVAVDETGGALVTADGTLHAFSHNPREVEALRTDAEIALARCLLQLGQAKEAARTIEAVTARSPENIEALAIQARADTALIRDRALASWLKVSTRDATTPSLRVESRQALENLAGIRVVDDLDHEGELAGAAHEFATAEDMILVRTGNEVAAFDVAADRIAWRLPGAELRPAAGAYAVIEGRLVDVRKGTPTRGAPRDREVAYVNGGVVRLTDTEGFIFETFERPPHRLSPSPGIPVDPTSVILGASDALVLLGTPDAPETLEARAPTTGRRIWRQTLGQGLKIERALTVDATVFAITATCAIALEANTGRPRPAATFERQAGDRIVARSDLLLTIHGDQVRIVDPTEGPHRKALTMPAAIADVAIAGAAGAPIVFIAMVDGHLVLLDPGPAKIERSVLLAPIKAMAAVDRAVLISLESGVVLRAAAERRLKPAT